MFDLYFLFSHLVSEFIIYKLVVFILLSKIPYLYLIHAQLSITHCVSALKFIGFTIISIINLTISVIS
jgi:hypothetical protein